MREIAWRLLGLSACLLIVARADDEALIPLIDLVELEFEEKCSNNAETEWKLLLGDTSAFRAKLELDKAIANNMRSQYEDLRVTSADADLSAASSPLLDRKLRLLLQPGDAMLEVDQWSRLVSFGAETLHGLESATDYDCGNNYAASCSLSGVRKALASQTDATIRKRIKDSWEKKLPNENYYITQILPLLKNASKVNGYNSVEEYWEALVEYEGALVKAREMWMQIQPLYELLQKHVAHRLASAGFPVNTDTTIPVPSLGSLLGDDWSNVAELVLPQHADVYHLLLTNLMSKHIGGREAYMKAQQLIEDLKLGAVSGKFWDDSAFDSTCPARVVDFCVQGSLRVATCSDVTVSDYLDAHEVLMKVKYNEYSASFTNNTYIVREPNRYSAVFEGISGMASLLALSPHQLHKSKLVPLKYFEKNKDHNRMVLQMIMALRDLPRLNYYLAADEWRLKSLKQFPAPVPLKDSWSEFRRVFSLVEPGNKDFLGDPFILYNKPYLAKFFGIILKYQIFQSFDDYSYHSDDNIISKIASDNHRIIEPMTRAFTVKWPELVSDIVAKKEYGVDSNGILEYFELLKDYLEKQQNPTSNDIYDNFEQPNQSDLFEATSEKQSDLIVYNDNNEINNLEEVEEIHDKENMIENGPVENVLPNKHMIGNEHMEHEDLTASLQNKEGEDVQEAGSSNLYMWIGIGIVIAIILILIMVIIKKRVNHRNNLEKQRKEQSRA